MRIIYYRYKKTFNQEKDKKNNNQNNKDQS